MHVTSSFPGFQELNFVELNILEHKMPLENVTFVLMKVFIIAFPRHFLNEREIVFVGGSDPLHT